MKKKKIITPEKLFNGEEIFQYFKKNGKYYLLDGRDGKAVYVEVSKKQVDEHLNKAKELAKKLKESVDAEKILTEVFMVRYNNKELDKLYKTVFQSKRKYKAKTRKGHCVDLKVGNHIIPLVD